MAARGSVEVLVLKCNHTLSLEGPQGVAKLWRKMCKGLRDEQVLDLLVQGCRNKEIAGQSSISTRTVKQH
jgi:DNA-binding NarL/FixJ family response regulator